jgi:hypothetical protein
MAAGSALIVDFGKMGFLIHFYVVIQLVLRCLVE